MNTVCVYVWVCVCVCVCVLGYWISHRAIKTVMSIQIKDRYDILPHIYLAAFLLVASFSCTHACVYCYSCCFYFSCGPSSSKLLRLSFSLLLLIDNLLSDGAWAIWQAFPISRALCAHSNGRWSKLVNKSKLYFLLACLSH